MPETTMPGCSPRKGQSSDTWPRMRCLNGCCAFASWLGCEFISFRSRYGRSEGPYDEDDISSENTAHGVADKNDIGVWPFMRLEPLAELIPGNLDSSVCLVAGV